MAKEVERYSKATRYLHWMHAISFSILLLTGLILFVPALGFLAEDSWTRILHRIAAVLFVVAPMIYVPLNMKRSGRGILSAFKWGKEDIRWLLAAPRYYFLCDEEAMPPQGHMNAGQKMWWLIALVFGSLFVVTGGMMWFAKDTASPGLLQWAVIIHDVSFIVTMIMFFVHIYMSAVHPLTRPLKGGSWDSMFCNGKMSADFAKAHYAKWYEEVSENKDSG
ncbi:MAG TPA: formate dehydrogenase subunit gamma [Dehalococcoidia bacterium]|nr:formate dehydrogenase subunit gamma [Dehalococcoidia bacterium]